MATHTPHTPTGGPAWLALRSPDGATVVAVADTPALRAAVADFAARCAADPDLGPDCDGEPWAEIAPVGDRQAEIAEAEGLDPAEVEPADGLAALAEWTEATWG